MTVELTQALNTQNDGVPEVPEYKPEEDFSKEAPPATCEVEDKKEEQKRKPLPTV